MKAKQPKLRSADVVAALRKHFESHIVFTEVKNGPTFGGSHRRLDVMAVKRTWSPITIVGVEVKISRSDFTADDKWPEYLLLCQQFYWACPAKLIDPSEIDPRCGLIYVYETGAARTVKRAQHRDIPPDPYMLLYLLLWRDDRNERHQNADRERIIQEMRENKRIGEGYRWFVAEKLNEAHKLVEDADRSVKRAKNEAHEALESVKLVTDWCAENHLPMWELKHLLETCREVHNMSRFKSQLSDLVLSASALDKALKLQENQRD